MGTRPTTLGQLTNLLLADTHDARAACITSRTTGNPVLAEIDLRLPREVIALQYDALEDLDGVVGNYAGSLDLVVADPFHTYESSRGCLSRCLRLLRPGGLLVVHDCVPPPEMISPEPLEREWSGVTFAAFRDIMIERNLPWCTLDTDYGIGIGVAVPSAHANDNLSSGRGWSPTAHNAYVAEYTADPYRFMRTVRSGAYAEAIDALRSGGDVAHLAAAFTGWEALLPLGAPGSNVQSPQPDIAGRSRYTMRRAAGRVLRGFRRVAGRR